MYYKFTIPVPKVQGKITFQKKGKATYVQLETGRTYMPEKKYTLVTRVSIGKLTGCSADMMYPNERYEDYFSSLNILDEQTKPGRSCALRIGTYIVIHRILQENRLWELLEKYFQETGGLLLDLLAFRVVHGNNHDIWFEDYQFCHPLFTKDMVLYDNGQVKKYLQTIKKEQVKAFIEEWLAGYGSESGVSADGMIKGSQDGDLVNSLVEMLSAVFKNRIRECARAIADAEGRFDVTVPRIIGQLERIEMVRRSGGVYRLAHSITDVQRTILSPYGITDQDVCNAAADISAVLSPPKK